MKTTITLAIGLWLAIAPSSFATTAALPHYFSFSGQLLDNNDQPLTGAQSLVLTIQDPTSACTLWEESQTVTPDAAGNFSILIGSGTATGNMPGSASWVRVFQNSLTIPATGCGSTYSPASGDHRNLKVTVNGTALPAISMSALPQATVAETLQGLDPSNFLQLTTSGLTQTNMEALFPNATAVSTLQSLMAGTSSKYVATGANGAVLPNMSVAPASPSSGDIWFNTGSHQLQYFDGTSTQTIGSGSGTVSSITAGIGLAGGTILTSGTLSLATIGTAGNYSKVTTDTYGRVVSGSNITGTDITSGTIGGTTSISTSGTLTTTGNLSAGNLSTNGTLSLGNGTYAIGLQAPVGLASPMSLTLPSNPGTAGDVLMTNGTGTLNWMHPQSISFANNGNAFGVNAVLGTNDPYALGFKVNNTLAMQIAANGFVGIGTTNPVNLFEVDSFTPNASGPGANVKLMAQSSTYSTGAGGNIFLIPGAPGGSGAPGAVVANGPVAVGFSATPVQMLSVLGTPQAASTSGLVNIGSSSTSFSGGGGAFYGNPGGTALAMNMTSFSGNLLDLQNNGVSEMSLSSNGTLSAGSVMTGTVQMTPGGLSSSSGMAISSTSAISLSSTAGNVTVSAGSAGSLSLTAGSSGKVTVGSNTIPGMAFSAMGACVVSGANLTSGTPANLTCTGSGGVIPSSGVAVTCSPSTTLAGTLTCKPTTPAGTISCYSSASIASATLFCMWMAP